VSPVGDPVLRKQIGFRFGGRAVAIIVSEKRYEIPYFFLIGNERNEEREDHAKIHKASTREIVRLLLEAVSGFRCRGFPFGK